MNPRSLLLLVVVCVVVLTPALLGAAVVLAGPVRAAPASLSATLTGANEVNNEGEPNQGDPDGTGSAQVIPRPAKKKICFDIAVSSIALPATAAHIHKAPAGQNGPPVVTLEAPGQDGNSSGCLRAKRALIKDTKRNPSGYYVNVHNEEYPGGALRGSSRRKVRRRVVSLLNSKKRALTGLWPFASERVKDMLVTPMRQ